MEEEINMDLNLRKAILANIKSNDDEQLRATIVEAIDAGEEKTLPGLGYLFELIWNTSNPNQQEEMIDSLKSGIDHAVTT